MQTHLLATQRQGCPADELMAACADAGYDAPVALVREGSWIEPNRLAAGLQAFMHAAERAALRVRVAATRLEPAFLARTDHPLRILAQHGIADVRLGCINRDNDVAPRLLAREARRLLEEVAESARRAGVRAIVPLHGGRYPHNATAAYPLIKDLDPAHIGVMLDPGQAWFAEGTEHPRYQCRLLHEYVAAVAVRDVAITRPGAGGPGGKGWQRHYVPIDEGLCDWEAVIAALHELGFTGPWLFTPGYEAPDAAAFQETLRRERQYFADVTGRITPGAR